MTGISYFFFALAIPCVLAGIILMMAMATSMQKRGHQVNWLWIRLYIFKYISQYRKVTIQETGRSGPLFFPFVISMNAALVFVVVGLLLK